MDPVERVKTAVIRLVEEKRALEIAERRFKLALKEFNAARNEGDVYIPLPMLVQGDLLLDARWESGHCTVTLTKVNNYDQIGQES